MERLRLGVVITGSFCTLQRTIRLLRELAKTYDILPIFSFNVASMDTRFYRASDFRRDVEEIVGKPIIDTIEGAEPIGPKGLTDIMIVLPCTGNTLAKIANGITDTPATMAVKAHIRSNKPVVIALATNDALGASFRNIAIIANTPNFYFVPYAMDDSVKKPKSLVYLEDRVIETLDATIEGKTLPIL